MSVGHPLHRAIGAILADSVRDAAHARVLLDSDCGGQQRLPLFSSDNKSRRTQFCSVDALVLSNERVSVIVEIEESDTKPTQVCGKFLTSALSAGFIHELHGDRLIPMADSVLFVQVLDTQQLVLERTSKLHQWDNIAASIRGVLPLPGTKIDRYELFHGRVADFETTGSHRARLEAKVRDAISQRP